MSFLTAEWRKLIFANYEIDERLLQDHLPAKTELDKWNGTCYVSLIGFMFRDVRLLRLKIPFHVHFPEVNLRFYVRHKYDNEWRRGVVFIKEIVPKPAITFVANTLYKERYQTRPMRHQWKTEGPSQIINYEWKHRGQWQLIEVEAGKDSKVIPPGSEAEFITEHYWGYSRRNENTSFEYQVTHPRWEVYPVSRYNIQVEFGQVYGRKFTWLNEATPRSVMLAEGSPITIEDKRKL